MKANEASIKVGGLMRCCIATIHDLAASGVEVADGQTFHCKYESADKPDSIKFEYPAFRWNREAVRRAAQEEGKR